MKESMPLKAGFSLVEITIGLAILGIAGSIIVPSFHRQLVRYEHASTVATLDSIVAQAWLNALKTGKVHRFKVNLKLGSVTIEAQKIADNGEIIYEKVPFYFSPADFTLPKAYQVVNFYIDGTDECAQHGAGRTMEDVWFFIYPQGHAQAVVINILNAADTTNSAQGHEIGLVLNPFIMQFEVHDAFQKP